MSREIRRHTPEEVDTALVSLIYTGSARETAKQLDLAERTVQDWRHRYSARYDELAAKLRPEIEQRIADQARQAAQRASDGVQEAIALERMRLEQGDVKDASASARNLATTAGILIDKTLLLEGRPNVISTNTSADEIVRRLVKLGVVQDADEITEANVIEERADERQDGRAPTTNGTTAFLAESRETNAQDDES